jgi:hypothetical protein
LGEVGQVGPEEEGVCSAYPPIALAARRDDDAARQFARAAGELGAEAEAAAALAILKLSTGGYDALLNAYAEHHALRAPKTDPAR